MNNKSVLFWSKKKTTQAHNYYKYTQNINQKIILKTMKNDIIYQHSNHVHIMEDNNDDTHTQVHNPRLGTRVQSSINCGRICI